MKIIDRFPLSEENLRSIVAEGLGAGGDWCDLFFEDNECALMVLKDGEVTSGGHYLDYGCGIRVLKGEKTGYAYAESCEIGALLSAARAAGSIASVSAGAGPVIPLKVPSGIRELQGPDHYPVREDWRTPGELEKMRRFLLEIDSRIRGRESRAIKVSASLAYECGEVMMYNSLGELCTDSRPLGDVSVQVVFRQGERNEKSNASRSFRCGAEMLDEALLEAVVDDVLRGVDELFEARRPKGGKMSVVMAAGASGILLHEAMGHAFEADFNRKGQSIFSGKMGQRVCPAGIDIIDDGTLDANRGACNFDDEGVPGQKTYMVTDGILTSYLHDRISAAAYGVAPTGNGRRESFRYNPIPRMRATYMANGHDGTVEDLIAGVKNGVYVDRFSNGEVKIGEGDFTFYVKSGFLIENGRLTMPVKDVNIIGNGPKALADIRGVASDLKIDNGTWTCGKEQNVVVSCGTPSVLIDGLTVGGE